MTNDENVLTIQPRREPFVILLICGIVKGQR
jgi:hypothetical protein